MPETESRCGPSCTLSTVSLGSPRRYDCGIVEDSARVYRALLLEGPAGCNILCAISHLVAAALMARLDFRIGLLVKQKKRQWRWESSSPRW